MCFNQGSWCQNHSVLCVQAWDYFLLRPAWLCRMTSWTAEHQKHLAAISNLRAATADLIQRAKAAAAEATGAGSHSCNGPAASECFLQKLLADEASGKLSSEAVLQLALEMLLAGTDTSSISLYYLMVQLAEDPELEQQLMREVVEAVGGCTPASCAWSMLWQTGLRDTHDMARVCCTALRVLPVAQL